MCAVFSICEPSERVLNTLYAILNVGIDSRPSLFAEHLPCRLATALALSHELV